MRTPPLPWSLSPTHTRSPITLTITCSPYALTQCSARECTAAARSMRSDPDRPRWLRRLYLPSSSMPWPVARSRVAAVTWTGRRITLAYGAGGRRCKASHIVTGTRPLGQGGGLARPAECTARQSARTVRTVSLAKAAVAHSLPGERSSVAASRLKRRVSLLRGWAGKCNR